jgi:hypothetical protein
MNIFKIYPFKQKENIYVNSVETDGHFFNYYFTFFTNYKWTIVKFYKMDDFFLENSTQIYTINKKNNDSYYKFLIINSCFKFIVYKIKNKIKNI